MGQATMLYPTMWLRGRTYWLRRVVPLELRERLGGLTEVRRSLRTRDPEEAKRRRKIESIKVDRLFDEARRGAVVEPTEFRGNVTEADREIIRDIYVDKLVADDQGDKRLPDHVRRRYLAFIQDDGSPRCDEILDRWVKERRPGSKTEDEWRKAWTRFIALGLDGQDLPVAQVTKKHARLFKERLLTAKGRHISTTISPTTVTKIIGACKSLMQWATTNGIIDSNPFFGVTVAGVKSASVEKARVPYDAADIKILFGPAALAARTTPEKKWLPILAYTTGARIEEIGQLRVADIADNSIQIRRGDGQSLKTAGSARAIPIHPHIAVDFLAYVAARRQAGEEYLFDLPRDVHGKRTSAFSKFWGRHARTLGIKDRRKTLHSFRHLYSDLCREAGVVEEVRMALMGHSSSSVSRRYGAGPSLRVLVEAVAKLRFELDQRT